jgi:hypothetical protein
LARVVVTSYSKRTAMRLPVKAQSVFFKR